MTKVWFGASRNVFLLNRKKFKGSRKSSKTWKTSSRRSEGYVIICFLPVRLHFTNHLSAILCFASSVQEQSEGNFERDRLRDQLMELKEQSERLEGLVNYLEEEKICLQDKIEKMIAAGRFGPFLLTTSSSSSSLLMFH